MKKYALRVSLVILLLLSTSAPALAVAQKWEIDKAHSYIYFDVRHTYALVRGTFGDFSGVLQIDPDNIAASSVSFEVRTKSIDTGIPERDRHLRSADFFDADTYPLMTFQSTAVSHQQGDRYTLEGNLSVKGRTQRVSLPFTFFGSRENPLKKGQLVAGFETRFSIDRLEYGVGNGRFHEMGVVGKDVEIVITIEALKQK